ncbi:protein BLISTER-like [Phragmites australis]|uniref:protein BLISTER-like n=1 Tax=Phragmites australis TaxID=29695 RepID=UPI002D769CC6|nr:protein BLISTER-like [Phragmites australis]
MASAQASSSSSAAAAPSRKEHLEAGKKRLEQFRKKKAVKKATAYVEQAKPIVPDVVEKPPPIANTAASSGDGLLSDVEPNIASTSSVPSAVYENDPLSSSRGAEFLSNGPASVSASVGVTNFSSQQDAVSDGGSKFYGNLSFADLVNGHHENWRGDTALKRDEHNPDKDQSTSKVSAFGNTNSLGSPYSADTVPSWGRNSLSSQARDTEQSSSYSSSTLFGKSESSYTQDYSRNNDIFGQLRATSKDSSQVEQSVYASSQEYGSTFNNSRIADTVDHDTNVGITRNAADSTPVNFDKLDPFLSTGYPTTYMRSRPSFLDSIGVQRAPPTAQSSYGEPAKANQLFSNSNYQGSFLQQSNQQSTGNNVADIYLTSGSQEYNHEKESNGNSSPPDFSLSKEETSLQHGNQTFQNFTTHVKDDDFTALEQLIEDLTKEKFSLQRTLEKSQELAQTLATDNSALTDKFNQQAHIISQLTSDIERLQDEIQAQLLALESVRTEYANAQLECSAADERAKVLAAEVILLEDKALKLRSNELKLEKEVEGLHSEISSYRRKVSSLEKERQHLQSAVEALQEEKKLLHSKLRNNPVNEKVNIIDKSSADKRDASTATEDLDTGEISSSETLTSTIDTLEDAGTSGLRSNNMSDFPSFEEVSSSIPDDQLRMIDNINSLMSELAVEREELLRALRIESSNCSKLKELNKDLTQKLEIQTQRLELLTSQQMANENVLAKPIDTRSINDATMYADEGDEVVERVLGWIMKLFPGGPKRRTSKLL